MELGTSELLIILVIILLVFGVGRIAKVGSEMGAGLREFRRGLKGEEDQPGTEPVKKTDESPAKDEAKNDEQKSSYSS